MLKLTGSLFAVLLGIAPVFLSETPAQAQAAIRIQMAPPAPRVEVIPRAPSPRHVWVPGYWAWRGGRHVWIAGHYELPPRGMHTWIEPRWEHRGGSYVFIEGRWGL